jgi:methionine-rich copper-binding protein CopC
MRPMKTLLAIALLLLTITPALAHAHLLETVPANGSIVSVSPSSLTLKFSEGIELGFSGVIVTGPSGAVTIGAASLDPADDTRLFVEVLAALPAGTYTIAWHTVSTDGHKTTGIFAFTVK